MSVSELRPDDPELVVLSVLAGDTLYGYAISKRVAARSSEGIMLTPGVLYPLLAKLESQGFLVSTWETVKSDRNEDEGEGGGGRRRKWYKLSAKGRKRLAASVEAHRRYQSMIRSFLTPPEETA